jgi:exopolyphosphatase/guanosine-5'-triphosphate,3'-diphosphate pyrophosphatase
MPFSPPATLPRYGVVDLGSNSVRLVVYEGQTRNPTVIFNEKAVLRLGQGLQETGLLNEEAVVLAQRVMHRYHAVARAMHADPFEVLATAAVRDARNGAAFVDSLRARMPGVPIRVLTGIEEAEMSAEGVLCGIPEADGLLADIGGGSLELVRVGQGGRGASSTTRLGVIRLSERAGRDLNRAREIAEADLREVAWLPEIAGRDLYPVGGAWRALARMHMLGRKHPLQMVHHYTLDTEELRRFIEEILSASRRELEKMPGAPRRRIDDLPFAAVVLRRLLRVTAARRVVFSASGLREGWFMRQMPAAIRTQDPLMVAAHELAERHGRDPAMPPALMVWTDALFPRDTHAERRLREGVCWLSDIGSHEHPEFRAEQAFYRVLRQPSIGLDHPTRAFLAIAVATRYEADATAPFVATARTLLDPVTAARAEVLGSALRLAYTLSAGTPDILAGTALRVRGTRLLLTLHEDSGVFSGEAVIRRLERLAKLLGLDAATEVALLRAAE